MTYKIGLCLSGCGVNDGSEIHEAVCAMIAITAVGAEVVCMAPDVDQMHVVDHLAGQPVEGESRNVLKESARIARGDIKNLADVTADDLDALVFPGGFGAAKNLCDYAVAGPDMKVQPEVARIIKEMRGADKPVAAMCIAPVILAAVVGREMGDRPQLTIGTDPGTAGHIEQMGAEHVNCQVKDAVTDKKNKIVTTPAYMLAKSPAEVSVGADRMMKALIELIEG